MVARLTLAKPTPRIAGVGLHTGASSWVALHPGGRAAELPGIVFLHQGRQERITASCVVDTRRCTVVQAAGARLSTVEHLMSALAGSGITDAVVEFDGSEIPILDGSARGWADAIDEAGTAHLDGEIAPLVIDSPIDISGERGERIVALPSPSFELTVVLDYASHPAIGAQAAIYRAGQGDYRETIASARTYGFLSELEQIKSLGLATGATWDSGIALEADGSAHERTPLRFSNELARHKLLDIIGDLALVGRPLQAHIVALRPSHAVNSRMAAALSGLVNANTGVLPERASCPGTF